MSFEVRCGSFANGGPQLVPLDDRTCNSTAGSRDVAIVTTQGDDWLIRHYHGTFVKDAK